MDSGSDQYPGAAVMSVYGAVYGGAGYVRYLGAERPAATISAQLPNVVFSPGRVQARLFGSGWGERTDGAQVLARAAEEGVPAVVDLAAAIALYIVAMMVVAVTLRQLGWLPDTLDEEKMTLAQRNDPVETFFFD